ncbi:BZIP transcription factor [Phytophthora nicotianae]|uniref:BZIP transcription factor n=1 Tax=Phytophthora nicotianae TaxID=4792 RepID=A0A0W8DJV5_PHYNI|nr:BZIP transcription factor [Phytophthora nicotianae]
MCTAVYKRLQVVSEELSKISDEEAMRQNRVLFMYGNTIANFLKFLQKQAKKSFIRRLAGNRKVVAAIQDFNEDIDELYKLLTVVHIQEMAKWKREWDEDRRKQEQKLLSMATNHQRILADIRNQDNNLVESLAMLKYEMTHKKAQNSMAALAMMKRTFNKITRTSGAKVPAVPEWFISSDDVDFDVNDQFDSNFVMLVFLRANRELWDFTSLVGYNESAGDGEEDAE